MKYPDRVPLFCEKASNSDVPDIGRKKFLVPGTMTCGELKYVIHKQVNRLKINLLTPDQTIYLFAGGSSPKTGARMSEIYANHRAEDGSKHWERPG